jgi:hypothetical protein
MSDILGETDLIRVVLADANVLYSRVLRDYLLYAADQEIIAIAEPTDLGRGHRAPRAERGGLRPGGR